MCETLLSLSDDQRVVLIPQRALKEAPSKRIGEDDESEGVEDIAAMEVGEEKGAEGVVREKGDDDAERKQVVKKKGSKRKKSKKTLSA